MKDFNNVCFKWTFRDYQQEVLDNAEKHLKDKRIHIVAAPGSGKTILGLELIRRLNSPALILSPSVTIRQQWCERFVEAYLPENAETQDYVSFSITKPELITSITYQAFHAAFTKTILDTELDEDELPTEETQNFIDFDLFKVIKNSDIKTICLDEAHHLKSEWQKALEEFLSTVDKDMTIIALTATPPYDSTPAEWNRYQCLCGDIDEEIFVPQLVKQKTLCPHQDYIYFSYPTEEENQILSSYKAKALKCTDEIIKSGLIEKALNASGVLVNEEILYDNIDSFKSILCVAKKGSANIPKTFEAKVFEGKKPFEYSISEAERAFQFIIDKPDLFGEDISEELRTVLARNALIEKRKVRIVSSDKINKMLISSTGKLDSIDKIVSSEWNSLGQQLHMLILTDFIKKDMMSLIGTDKEIHALGTVPIFESVRRSSPQTNVALLSGTLVIVPDSAVESVQEIAYNEGISCKINKIENTNHTEIIFAGSNKNKVSIITKAFQKGVINVLVGTKSLLGEGWDSPNINSLVLASFIGSFMLSNQMRGRAIRIDKGNPQKVSNIWHLVTVEPDSQNEIVSNDFETVKRRFDCFQAPAYSNNVIESGIDRIDILKAPFDEKGLESINNKMLSLASDRYTASQRWTCAVKESKKQEIVQVSEIPSEVQPTQVINKSKITAIVLATLIAVAVMVVFASGFIGGLLGVAFAVTACILLIKPISIILRNSSPKKTVLNLSKAIFYTLKEVGQIESKGAFVFVEMSDDKSVINCSLEKATVREKNVFSSAVSELLSPIDNPRYLLIGTKGILTIKRKNYVQSYACPSIIAANKETSERLAENLKRTGNDFEIVFTRNEAGRKELFKCRKHSYINLNSKTVRNKKVVR